MGLFGPNWWHHHGTKMHLQEVQNRRLLIISGSVAKIIISPATDAALPENTWLLKWEVHHSRKEGVQGCVLFSTKNLRAAFSIPPTEPEPGHKWLYDQYGATSAIQGKYIRQGAHLTIPCPGTGHDGDPNISLELNDEICGAVTKLMAQLQNFL